MFTAKKQGCSFTTGNWSRLGCTRIRFASPQEKERITVTTSLLLHLFTVPFFLDFFFIFREQETSFSSLFYSFYYDLHLFFMLQEKYFEPFFILSMPMAHFHALLQPLHKVAQWSSSSRGDRVCAWHPRRGSLRDILCDLT